MARLFVLVPVFNEADALARFAPALVAQSAPKVFLAAHSAISAISSTFIVFVNDGSTDATAATLQSLTQTHAGLSVISLSRNFGKEAALLAGLDAIAAQLADGDLVAIMDGDGQDPPATLVAMIARLADTAVDGAMAVRVQRTSESWFTRITALGFQAFMRRFSDIHMRRGASDFCVFRAHVVRAMVQVREVNRFFKGITEWVGFRIDSVPYDQAPRVAGATKWGVRARSRYAWRGIVGYSKAPLYAVTGLGFAMAGLAFAYGGFIIFRTLFFGEPVRGYPTLMVTVLALGGLQLLALGVIGQYLGRTLDEVRRRPVYVVANTRLADGLLSTQKTEK